MTRSGGMGTTLMPAVFLGFSSIAVAGAVWSALGITYATTVRSSDGAFTTGVALALSGLAALVVAPQVPSLSSRLGPRRCVVLAKCLTVVVSVAVGCLVASGDLLLPLMFAMPLLGGAGAVAALNTPGLTRAYLGGESVSLSTAIRSTGSGIGAVVGALTGAAVISQWGPGWALVGRGLLEIPIILLLAARSPIRPIGPVHGQPHPWRTVLADLSRAGPLRRASVLSLSVAILVMPLISMIVPILSQMRQSPLVTGAGYMLAGIAIGRLFTPLQVRRLLRRRDDLGASLLAIRRTAAVMILLAAAAAGLSAQAQLTVLVLGGIGIGATRFASRSLTLGAASAALGPGRSLEGVAVIGTAAMAGAPVGTLAWGLALHWAPPAAVLAVCAAVMAAVATLLQRAHERDVPPQVPGGAGPALG